MNLPTLRGGGQNSSSGRLVPALGLGSAADEGRGGEVEKRSAPFAAARAVLTAAAGAARSHFLTGEQGRRGVLELGYRQGKEGWEGRMEGRLGGAADELGNRATEGVGAGVQGRADTCPSQTLPDGTLVDDHLFPQNRPRGTIGFASPKPLLSLPPAHIQ